MKQLTGSEIVIECLKEQGVDTVFGYPGGTILNVYDALYKHQDEIHHVLTSHEQGARIEARFLSVVVFNACIAVNPPIAISVIAASEPPQSITSAYPSRI